MSTCTHAQRHEIWRVARDGRVLARGYRCAGCGRETHERTADSPPLWQLRALMRQG